MRENSGRPFFLFVPSLIPHAELVAPDDSIYALYKGEIEEVKSFVGVDAGEQYKRGPYGSSQLPRTDFAAMVTRLDMHVGQIVAELKRLGIDRNTLVILSSDNGPHREGGADPDFFKSYGPLRGYKRDLFEGGIRVPMIAAWPGTIKSGSVSHHISAFWDVMPTLKELAGVRKTIDTDGISMIPTLFSRKGQRTHDYLYWEFHEGGGKMAVRKGNWKGIKLNYAKNPEARMLLFDLSTDLREQHNIAAEHPDIVAELEQIMRDAREESDVFTFGVPGKVNANQP